MDRAQAEIRRVSKQSLSGVGEAASQIEAGDAEPAVVEEAAGGNARSCCAILRR